MSPWKCLPLLTSLLLGATYAEPLIGLTSPRNLNGVKFCFEDRYVRVDDPLQDDGQRTLATTIARSIRTKLIAYRIPIAQNCGETTGYVGLWLNLSTSNALGNTQARSYNVELLALTKVPNLPSNVAIYNQHKKGVSTNATLTDQRALITQLALEMIDKLGADYAMANP
ncbi:hypothetical protein [Deinococcus depolymerans]|uniref:hypothetical protein n=1 Tax=Deinococcus depolymerans TaxID=392408 RepID=UPI003094A4BA